MESKTAAPAVTLEQLRDHAAARPDHPFDLGHCWKCLAAEATGKPMDTFYRFEDNTVVPKVFGDFCETVRTLQHQKDKGRVIYPGSRLAPAVQQLIDGKDPLAVANLFVG